MKPHLLLVEDEPGIARGLVFNLEEEGFKVTHVETGEEALDLVWDEHFDLVILDVMLPGISGLEVCQKIRRHDSRLPVIMLTARSEEQDRIDGLATGADDYLTKPFSLDEFMLRVKGMLRRSEWYRPGSGLGRSYRFGSNEVNLKEQKAMTARGELPLTELEVRMLRTFFRHEGETLSRAELLAAVWGMAPDTETRTLDNFIVRMRKYFEADPSKPAHFLTLRGRGYRFSRRGSQ
ncbi:response regulator transcription factor [Trichloromonas sp.]|uniref:response regulator transcription factor n=1 Tax=Trichloromonas sp. TaxID=3069249 RepID=UPI003D813A28